MNISIREVIVFTLVAFGVVLLGLVIVLLFGGLGGMRGGMMLPRNSIMLPLGTVLLCMLSLVLFGLSIGGIAWVIGSRTKPEAPDLSHKSCPNCGRPVQADWRVCPYCETTLYEGDQR